MSADPSKEAVAAAMHRLTREEIILTDTELEQLFKDIKTVTAALTAAQAERDGLRAWKESAMAVEREWDAQAVSKALGVPLGAAIRPAIFPGIVALQQRVATLGKLVENTVPMKDYHGMQSRAEAAEAALTAERQHRERLAAALKEVKSQASMASDYLRQTFVIELEPNDSPLMQALIHADNAAVTAESALAPSQPAPSGAEPSAERGEADGIALIAAERARQVSQEGWTPRHDDEHTNYELSSAACCYAQPGHGGPYSHPNPGFAPAGWPWDEDWWKPSEDVVRNLVKAGALIAAEIDRLQRAAAQSSGTSSIAQKGAE